MQEIWKDIKGYEGLYQVSNLGRIKSIKKEIILKQTFNKYRGYYYIGLHKNNKGRTYPIHRLVAIAFIPNTNNEKCVNHKDCNRQNNRADNLEWCSHSYNTIYAFNNNRFPNIKFYKTNTGHHHISYSKTNKTYRIKILGKEQAGCKTLEEAIAKRDEILKGIKMYG